MKPHMYGIPNCDTIRRAQAYLRARGIAFEFHDYRRDPVPLQRLTAWAQTIGWEALLNRKGTTFRALPPKTRESLDEQRALALMTEHPTLIRRPVLVVGESVLVGFDDAARRALDGLLKRVGASN